MVGEERRWEFDGYPHLENPGLCRQGQDLLHGL